MGRSYHDFLSFWVSPRSLTWRPPPRERRSQAAARCLCTSWGKLMKGTSWWLNYGISLYTDTDIQVIYISLYISTITSSHECTYHSTYLQLQVVMHVRTHMIYIYRHTYNTHTYIHEMPCHAMPLHYIALHCVTFNLHYITLHYTTLHYIALHYTTLHHITLHTYQHMCRLTCLQVRLYSCILYK